ncbi:DUF4199 domain-containing protein [Flammeovirga sp. SJP92]|uniref:DUF4199 domain-containing protein n=1 Tax=Flammeovirga sp. SJP92 TaxID=1775430 RepID=UPI00078834FC|nr:DUF4199 domain-containing protein [Flammeovirga sp. SJP92]KXX68421.1 hypothetical protein AVL50_21880 [Flammeovirga sp. SJP92]
MQDRPSAKTIALKYAAILGIFSFGYPHLLEYLGKTQNVFLINLNLVVIITTFVFAFREYRSMNNNVLLYETGKSIGILLSFTSSAISNILGYVYFHFFDRSALDQGIELSKEMMAQKPGINEADLEKSYDIIEFFFNTPLLQISNVLILTLVGYIFSVLLSRIMQREPVDPNQDYDF